MSSIFLDTFGMQVKFMKANVSVFYIVMHSDESEVHNLSFTCIPGVIYLARHNLVSLTRS